MLSARLQPPGSASGVAARLDGFVYRAGLLSASYCPKTAYDRGRAKVAEMRLAPTTRPCRESRARHALE